MQIHSKLTIKTVIISRTDAIGDVVLTLPLCGIIKKFYPEVRLLFMGRGYTEPVINCCEYIDGFINADELLAKDKKEALIQLASYGADVIVHVFPNRQITLLAKQVGIKYRIGTTNRLFHWGTVNKLIRLSRKNSALHEAQLNFKLLEPLGIFDVPELEELSAFMGFGKIPALPEQVSKLILPDRINVILHPKSNAHAREWSLSNYKSLIDLLPSEKYRIFISGNEQEGALLADWIKTLPVSVTDVTGKFSLSEFIAFIAEADFLVAPSTGPLHIASAIGTVAIGLFPNIRPMHPGRWRPIGNSAFALSTNIKCSDCRNNPSICHCINEITPQQVAELLVVPQGRNPG